MTLTAHKPVTQQVPGIEDHEASKKLESASRADLTMVLAASSEIENLQWQLDRAQLELKDAVHEAFHNGADISEIAPAADLDADEVQALLQA